MNVKGRLAAVSGHSEGGILKHGRTLFHGGSVVDPVSSVCPGHRGYGQPVMDSVLQMFVDLLGPAATMTSASPG